MAAAYPENFPTRFARGGFARLQSSSSSSFPTYRTIARLPPMATPGTTGTVHPLDPARQIVLRAYPADRPGVAAAARAVADPDDPLHDHYLTPRLFQQQFGTTADQAGAVRTWLTGQGMTVTASTPHYIAVTG